jgi:hypothetical protein
MNKELKMPGEKTKLAVWKGLISSFFVLHSAFPQ